MEITAGVRAEWLERHVLCRESLAWLTDHADAGDEHPIVTAVAQLRVTP